MLDDASRRLRRLLQTVSVAIALVGACSAVAPAIASAEDLWWIEGTQLSRISDDGTDLRQSGTSPAIDSSLITVSPDGQQTAFMSDYSTFGDHGMIVADQAGKNPTQVTSYWWDAAFAPDSRFLWLSAQNEVYRVPLDQPGAARQLVFSPGTNGDGSARFASRMTFTADGSTMSFIGYGMTGMTAYVTPTDGSAVQEVPIPASVGSVYSEFRISPDGQSAVFVAGSSKECYGLWCEQRGHTDVWRMNLDGTGLVRLTSTPDADEYSPTWSPDGAHIAYLQSVGTADAPCCLGFSSANRSHPGLSRSVATAPSQRRTGRRTPAHTSSITYEVRRLNAVDGSGDVLLRLATDYPASLTYRTPKSFTNYQDLLQHYAPQLRYDTSEIYYSDSAQEATIPEGNKVHADTPQGDMTLAAHGVPGVDELNLGWLGVNQNDPLAPQSKIDEGDDSEGDASAMHADSALANQAYGRAVQDSAGKWWLQYWLYYYYNDVIAEPTHAGNHEGDWEMVAIGFDSRGVPDKVALAQHASGMLCGWGQLNHTTAAGGGSAVRVYPAAGTHATYPFGGVWGPSSVHPVADYAEGDDTSNWIVPHVNDITNPPGWLLWPGFWGNSVSGSITESTSPKSPANQNPMWDDIRTWALGLNSCDTSPQSTSGWRMRARGEYRLPETSISAPSPHVIVTRLGRRAGVARMRVSYRIPASPTQSARPTRIVVRFHDSHGRSVARSIRVRGRTGAARLILQGAGRTVRASAESVSPDGHRSGPRDVPLH